MKKPHGEVRAAGNREKRFAAQTSITSSHKVIGVDVYSCKGKSAHAKCLLLKLWLTLALFGIKVKSKLDFLKKNAMIKENRLEGHRAMKYVIGAVTGLLWGALVAWLNSRISKKAIEKNSTKAMMLASLLRTALDIAALALVFLLRNVLPGNFEATIVGTAASLGLLTVYFAYRLSKPEKKKEE